MKKRFIIDFIYYFLIFLLAYIFIKYILSIIFPIVMGLLIAIALRPASLFLQNSLKLRPKTATFLAVFLFYIAFLALFFLISCNLFDDLKLAADALQKLYTNLSKDGFADIKYSVTSFLQKSVFSDAIIYILNLISSKASVILAEISLFIAKCLSSIAKILPTILLNILLTILSSFLFACEYNFLRKTLHSPHFRIIFDIKRVIANTFRQFFLSYAIIFSTTFLTLLIGFFIAKIENFYKLALLISLLDLLPAVGIGVVLIPWIVTSLLKSNTIRAVTLLIIYFICLILRNILEPKLLSKTLGISPLMTIITMILGAQIFGVVGAICAPFSILIAKDLYSLGYFKRIF